MGKLTRAQARKRLEEARKKLLLVAFEFPSPATPFRKLTEMAELCERMAKKLK